MIGVGNLITPTTGNFGGWQLGPGFYTTTSSEAALLFAEQRVKRVGGSPVVLNVYGRGSALTSPVPVPQEYWWVIDITSPFMLPPSLTAPISGFEFYPQVKFNPVSFPNLMVDY